MGLGIDENHPIHSNWLLLANQNGMKPQFTFRCGLAHHAKPTLAFGLGLVPKHTYQPRYYAIQKPDTNQPGSQWFLKIKKIIWKCKGQTEELIDVNHCHYAQAWKNTSKDKVFNARNFSWAWFDMGLWLHRLS